jgi:hypothetical protein
MLFSSHTATSIFSFLHDTTRYHNLRSHFSSPLALSPITMLCSCLLLMALGLIQTSVEKFLLLYHLEFAPRACELLCNRHRLTPYCSSYWYTDISCSRNLESIFRPRLLFGNRQGVQLRVRIVSTSSAIIAISRCARPSQFSVFPLFP